MKVTEYFIVTSNNTEDLERQVKEMLQTGWELKGPARADSRYGWYQTMVKRA